MEEPEKESFVIWILKLVKNLSANYRQKEIADLNPVRYNRYIREMTVDIMILMVAMFINSRFIIKREIIPEWIFAILLIIIGVIMILHLLYIAEYE